MNVRKIENLRALQSEALSAPPIVNSIAELLNSIVKHEYPCALLTDFVDPSICKRSIEEIKLWAKVTLPLLQKKEPDRTSVNYWSMDILPRGVQTNRIMRNFLLGDLVSQEKDFPTLSVIFSELNQLHHHNLACNEEVGTHAYKYAPQVLHYPEGGGFFDWHLHQRMPQNYGLLLMLDDGIQHRTGQAIGQHGSSMALKYENTIISTQGHMRPGDLFVFRFDLEHCILPHMHKADLNLTSGGAYYAVNPLIRPVELTS